MSTWTDTVNAWGEAWLNWAGASALQSSLLIVVVLALARWLRGRVNPVWIHGLWMLVLVKLVLPPTATSSTSLGYWLPRPNLVVLAESHNEALTRVTVGVSTMPSLSVVWTDGGLSEEPGYVSPDGDGLTWQGGLAGLGLVGTLGVLGWVGRAGGRVRQEIGRSRLADAEWTAAASECATRLGLRRVPEVRFTAWLPSPAVCGLRRRVILIPEMLAERLEPEARRDVLLHEMAHVRRGDLWAGTIEILLLAVYWWHPLVWVTRARLRRLREEIADAVVVVEGQRDAGRYAETLLRVAKAVVGRPLLTVGLMGIVESGGALRRRVEVLLEDRPVRAPRLGWAGRLGWVVVALMVLPMGEGPRRANAVETAEAALGDPVDVRQNWTKNSPVKLPSVAAGVPPAVEPGVSPGGSGVTAVSAVLKEPQLRPLPADVSIVPGTEALVTTPQPDETSVPTNLVTRSYRLDIPTARKALEAALGKPVPDDERGLMEAAREFFEAAGVRLDPPAAVFVSLKHGLLMRLDKKGFEIVDKAVEQLTSVPPQIMIDARFVFATHPRLDGLLALPEASAEVLSPEAFRSTWEHIKQWLPEKHRSGRLRVLTLAGAPASITSHERIAIRRPGDEVEREEAFGENLEVLAVDVDEKENIVLRLKASRREFLGYREDGNREPIILSSAAVATPHLRSGETLMLKLVEMTEGALAPVKGPPRATMVYVTATLVDAAGNPLPHAEPK